MQHTRYNNEKDHLLNISAYEFAQLNSDSQNKIITNNTLIENTVHRKETVEIEKQPGNVSNLWKNSVGKPEIKELHANHNLLNRLHFLYTGRQ
jgi:hypothetical protein